jgi:uncharacterized protein
MERREVHRGVCRDGGHKEAERTMMCKRAFSALASMLSLGLMAMLPAPGHAASFDCAKASTVIEALICRDPGLSQLDDRLAAAYAAVRAQSGNSAQLSSAQRAWLVRRNQCQTAACVSDAYSARLGELGAGPMAESASAGGVRQTENVVAPAQVTTNAALSVSQQDTVQPDNDARDAFAAACSKAIPLKGFANSWFQQPSSRKIRTMEQAVQARRDALRTGHDDLTHTIQEIEHAIDTMEGLRRRNPGDRVLPLDEECAKRYIAFLMSIDESSWDLARKGAAQESAAGIERQRQARDAQQRAADEAATEQARQQKEAQAAAAQAEEVRQQREAAIAVAAVQRKEADEAAAAALKRQTEDTARAVAEAAGQNKAAENTSVPAAPQVATNAAGQTQEPNALPPAQQDNATRIAFVAACSKFFSPDDFTGNRYNPKQYISDSKAQQGEYILNMGQAVQARMDNLGDQFVKEIKQVQASIGAMEDARRRDSRPQFGDLVDPTLGIGEECARRYLAFLQSIDAPSRDAAKQEAAQRKAAYDAEKERKRAASEAADAARAEAKAAAQREVDSLPACDDATVLRAVKGMLADSPAGKLVGLHVSGFEQIRDDHVSGSLKRYCSANLLTTAGAMRVSYSIRWTEAHDDIWVEARLLPN